MFKRIFISHKERDKNNIDQISRIFDEAKILYYISERDHKGGNDITDKIVYEMKYCTDVLVVITDEVLKDPKWIIKEIGMAYALKKRIIPVNMTNRKAEDVLKELSISVNVEAIPATNIDSLIHGLKNTFNVRIDNIEDLKSKLKSSMQVDSVKSLKMDYYIKPAEKPINQQNIKDNKFDVGEVIIGGATLLFVMWLITHAKN